MHDNNVYNLMMQSVQEHKSLWRILNDYREDAEGDEELVAFWEQLATDKAAQIEALQTLLAARATSEEDGVDVPTPDAE